ncbi:MAG: Exodeoxyribonuclease 7 large subunit [Candidatus Magasanikbacteria bacterium GW2011_GWA2_46_17]|uniref:Exodeoxyribonuclease 7 large subunit n=1 Tax=Candidatus Magasanikbacteria bacterium GW2011_GWA2_46_17 TaxID=1619042 RepID=A0A0G1R7K9_9BACT|nr:MAG: Exodeoxyribonuclease 7 large subunit [Candidatus Magasanikbacteria bacterium GW2011_GWA2_46_17]
MSQYKISQGKWVFFDLKDERSVVNCFSTVYTLRALLEDGMKIRVTGYPKIHDRSGRFSITVQAVELVGVGSLQRAYLLLKQKLTAEGLFDPARKRPLPFLPTRVGVIGSKDSAGFGDFKRILNNRWSGLEIELRHVAVQGEQAVSDIVQAFQEFNKGDESDRPEVIALIRGGGSMEDLAAFNTEEVARAIYGSKAPVICGVGHEKDETLADLVADVRASTPSNAAERMVPDRKDFISQLDFTLEHLGQKLEHKVFNLRHEVLHRLNAIASYAEAPLQKCRLLVGSFYGLVGKLETTVKHKAEFILSCERLLKSFNPGQVLNRGYSITRGLKGAIITNPSQVDVGEEIVVELSKGKIHGKVSGKEKEGEMEQAAMAV